MVRRREDRAWRIDKYAFVGQQRLCYLGAPDGPQTVFVVHGPIKQTAGPPVGYTDEPIDVQRKREAKVFEVIVRDADYRDPDERVS